MTLIARRRIGTTITYVLMAFLLLFTLFPFLWMLLSALKPADEIRLRTPSFLIRHPTFDNFTRVLVDHHFLTFIKNSLIVSLVACAFSLVISLLAGYVFSRHYRRKLVQSTNFAMLISQMVPPVLLLVPLYITMRNLELLDTYWALILAYTTFVIPLSTFMLSSAYDSIPASLEEAAEIDGAGRMRTLINVVIPVMIPSIVSVALYSFITAWNEFMFGYIFTSTDSMRTITPAIMLFKGANTVDWGGLMASSVIAVLPVAVIFLFLQRLFMSGMMSGAVKG